MSRLSDYNAEISGIVFEDPLDAIINKALEGTKTPGGGGDGTPTPTQTPSSRVKQLPDGKWYVVDDNNNPVTEGFRTQAMARFEAEKMVAQGAFNPVAQNVPQGSNVTPESAQRAFNNVMQRFGLPGIPDAAVEAVAAPQTASVPPTSSGSGAAGGGSGGGSSGGGSVAVAAKPERAFPKTNLATLFEWLHAGRITQDQLVNEMQAMGMTQSEMQFAIEDNPAPMGIQKGDIAAMFDPSRADFGAKGTFGSSSLGQGIREEGLFTPNSGGYGLVPTTNTFPQGGGMEAAAAVVGNQLFTPEHMAFITQQRGMKPGSTLSDLGQNLSLQQDLMNRTGANQSQSQMAVNVATGAYNPANDRINPSTGRPVTENDDIYELMRLSGQGVFREYGGPVKRGHPYVVGEKRPEVFVPEQDGTIVPRVPNRTNINDVFSQERPLPNAAVKGWLPRGPAMDAGIRDYKNQLAAWMKAREAFYLAGNYGHGRGRNFRGGDSSGTRGSLFDKALQVSMHRQLGVA